MANKESTAVNELIGVMQSGKSLHDVSDDLMFSPPKPRPKNPSRMTATIPPMRGEVPPLPRGRAPIGTSQHDVGKPQVRSTTAPPARSTTIPPLPRAAQPPARMPEIPKTPAPTLKTGGLPPPRPSRPSLPPPARSTQQPASSPVAAPFDSKPTREKAVHPFAAVPVATGRPPIDAPGDVVHADHWFEASRAMDLVDDIQLGTQTVQRLRDPGKLIKKLLAPMAVLVVVGVCVGGYLAFDGEGGKRQHVAAPAPTKVATPTKPTEDHRTSAFPAKQPVAVPEAVPEAVVEAKTEPVAPVAEVAAPKVEVAVAKPEPKTQPTTELKAAVAAPKTESVTEPIKAPAPVVPPPAPAKVAAVAPTAPVAAATRKFVDVRIDSKPAGATVMLVDNGKTSFLGTTPLSASIEPSRSYDVILTLEGRPTQMSHLDASKTQHIEISLGKTVAQAAPQVAQQTKPPVAEPPAPDAPVAAPAAPAKHHHHASAPAKVAGGIAEPSFEAPAEAKADKPKAEKKPEAKAEKKVAAADAKGNGILMVASKPPCEIWVDGKDTGLLTPQRSVVLAAGNHKITFVNKQENVMKTVAVAITADQSTKLIQDLMKK